MKKIYIASPFDKSILANFEPNDYQLIYNPIENFQNINNNDEIFNSEILVIATKPSINREILEKFRNLKLIIRMGIGIDHIDLKACEDKNVLLSITPNSNVLPVVELVFTQLINHYRNFKKSYKNLEKGSFRSNLELGEELKNKTIGVIGTGRIGSKICKLANFFEMNIYAYDPYVEDKSSIPANFVDMETLIKSSEIVTIHTPLTEETRNLVNFDFLEKMKIGSVLINTSRGQVAPMSTLLEYAKKGRISKFIIDVYEEEPYKIPDKYLEIVKKYFFLTPHIGAHTKQSLYNRSLEAYSIIEKFYKGEKLNSLIDFEKGY